MWCADYDSNLIRSQKLTNINQVHPHLPSHNIDGPDLDTRPTHGLGKQMTGPSAHRWPGVGRMPGCLAALRDLKVSNQTRRALGIEPLRPTHPDARMYDSETMR